MGACSVSWSCIAGESEGINVGDFENLQFTVAGYGVFQERKHLGTGNPSSTTYLRLNIQATGPQDRPATLALISFGERLAGDSHKIGHLAKRTNHPGEFEFLLSLPAADFDHYWKILTNEPRPHLRCVIAPIGGVDIEDFTLASAEFLEGELP